MNEDPKGEFAQQEEIDQFLIEIEEKFEDLDEDKGEKSKL